MLQPSISTPVQLSLAIPSWVGAMCKGESWTQTGTPCNAVAPYPWSYSVNWCLAVG